MANTIDFYDVLGLEHDCDKKAIKKRYRSLTKKYYPDKKGGDRELFELITTAYNILIDPKKRKEYDDICELSKQTIHTHQGLKTHSKNYYKAQKSSSVKKTKVEIEAELERMKIEFDKKNKINRNDMDAISEDDMNKRLDDMELFREQQEIECTHDKLFDKNNFNLSSFNAVFDKMKKKEKNGTFGTMTVHHGDPDGWNTDGINYSSYETSYDKLYAENDGNDLGLECEDFSNFNDSVDHVELTKEDIENLQGVEYTEGHNTVTKEYTKSLNEFIKNREMETRKLHGMSMDQFQEGTGSYGIFDQVGIDFNSQTAKIMNENSEDIQKRYQRLLNERTVTI